MAEQERLDRQKAAIRARHLAALAQAQMEAEEAARPAPQPAPAVEEPGSIWDTGPIRLARTAARTIRPSRRPGNRVTAGV
jgi:hypothetical protein